MEKKVKDIYIHETNTLWQEYGEVHILNDTHHIVWNADSLFKDISHLLGLTLKARKHDKEIVFNQIGGHISSYYEKKYILKEHYEEIKNNSSAKDSGTE